MNAAANPKPNYVVENLRFDATPCDRVQLGQVTKPPIWEKFSETRIDGLEVFIT